MTLTEIRQIFEADKYMLMTGVIIEEAGPDWCRCSLKVQSEHMNVGGAVQGGAIYTLADSAFAVASNMRHITEKDGKLTVSQSASISYITAGKAGSTLFAQAQKAGGGKRTSVYKIDVTDQDGRLIATMTGNGFTIELR
jgi:acyl-CoA thioesterase